VSLTYLLDEDISYRVAEGLRRLGIDAISVHEVGRSNRQVSDAEQLEYAAQQARVLVTYNRADYQVLDAIWLAQDSVHAGILWCAERSIPRRATGDLIRALAQTASQHESLTGLCLALPRLNT
jgi:predicted nuclease of predicted toxin-antitoxin system